MPTNHRPIVQSRGGQRFAHLRVTPWQPRFQWVGTAQEAADLINRPHEDYPHRVKATAEAIERLTIRGLITNPLLRRIHRQVFADTTFAGTWKEMDVLLSPSKPTQVSKVADLMQDL